VKRARIGTKNEVF